MQTCLHYALGVINYAFEGLITPLRFPATNYALRVAEVPLFVKAPATRRVLVSTRTVTQHSNHTLQAHQPLPSFLSLPPLAPPLLPRHSTN